MRFSRLFVLGAVVLAGCVSPPGDIPLGTTPHGVLDLREAQKTVKVYESVPEAATNVQDIAASRCHQNAFHTTPDDAMLTADLQILALRKELNGRRIAEIHGWH